MRKKEGGKYNVEILKQISGREQIAERREEGEKCNMKEGKKVGNK